MFFKFAAIALPALVLTQGTAASAIVARSTGPAAAAVEIAQVGATRPVSATRVASPKTNLASLAGIPIKTTSPNTGFRSLAATADPELLICTSQNCAGSCFEVDLFSIPENECFTSGIEFLSSAVLSSSALPFGVFVAQSGCADAVQLTTTNICFNLELNGEPADFIDFFTNA